MEQLCRKIHMPEEVTKTLTALHETLEEYPCLPLLMQQSHWDEGLAQLKDVLGEDPQGMKRLCCMLRCARKAKAEYDRLGIPDEIYVATMSAFSRFVREHRESYGSYGFDRGSWTPRQVSCKIFRIGQLEYELAERSGETVISLHIPTDADLRPQVICPSIEEGLATLCRLFPHLRGNRVYCHSWLLSPQPKDFLPESSNILHFQQLFDIDPVGIPGNDVLLWVFKNPKLPKEDYPEKTSLQRKLKAFFLGGGQFLEGAGFLRLPLAGITGTESSIMDKATNEQQLLQRMTAICADPAHPLMAAALGVLKEGSILFADAVGHRQLTGAPATGDTKFRIASISKLLTATAVWQLIERGLLDPNADASAHVGFTLRNPHHPGTPITVKMLLSHTSSIRDGGVPGSYNIPLGHHISEFFTAGTPHYRSNCWAPAGEAPGAFFAYCNMNYCLLGSVIESVSGERFDTYMIRHIFAPLGLSCSFNVSGMPPQVKAQVATLYRKVDANGVSDPIHGTWTAQCDDFTGGYPDTDYSAYEIGTNGSLFGPMGSLRISVRELCTIMSMFCHGGSLNGVQILKPETIEQMFAPAWVYEDALQNGDTYLGMMNCYGMGPHIFTNRPMGDRIVEHQVLPFAGHTADAYGLLGGMLFDRHRGNGIIYIVGGTGSEKNEYWGKYSAFYGWEEGLLTAAADFASFDY